MDATMNGGRRIAVREAQVKTAAVEIKALTIGGRQVTQSLFWQLQREDLIDDETLEFRGLPWGRVNYFRTPCKEDHLHVVWQKGDELRRGCVFEKGYREVEWYWGCLQGAQFGIGDLLSWRLARAELRRDHGKLPPSYSVDGERFAHMDRRRFLASDDVGRFYTLTEWADRAWFGYVVPSGAEREAADHERRHGTLQALEARILDDVRGFKEAQTTWRARWVELCALDQLFIAV